MATGTHIIHRLGLHIEVPGRNMAKKAQDKAIRYFEEVLLKQLEQLLDNMDVDDHLLIDTLELDLGIAPGQENFFEGLETKFAQTFQLAAGRLPPPEKSNGEPASILMSGEQQAFRVFLYFLQSGQLPWYAVSGTSWLQQEEKWLEKIHRAIADD